MSKGRTVPPPRTPLRESQNVAGGFHATSRLPVHFQDSVDHPVWFVRDHMRPGAQAYYRAIVPARMIGGEVKDISQMAAVEGNALIARGFGSVNVVQIPGL